MTERYKKLLARIKALQEESKTALDESEIEGLTAEAHTAKVEAASAKAAEVEALLPQLAQLKGAIEAEKQIAEAEAELSRIDSKAGQVPGAATVVVGEEPLDRAAVQKQAIIKFVCGGMGALTDEERKALSPTTKEDRELVAKAAGKGEDKQSPLTSAAASAGVLVPPEYRTELLRYMDELAALRPRATVITTNTNQLLWPRLAQGSHKFGGVVATWTAEAAAKTEAVPEFEQLEIDLHKMAAYTVVSDELLDDSNPAIATIVQSLFGDAVLDLEETAFLSGTGVAQPTGIINSAGIGTVARAGAGAVVYADLVNLTYGIPPRHRSRGVFIADDTVVQALKLLVDGQNRPLYYRSYREDGDAERLIGYPIVETTRTPNIGITGDIIFGDIKQYVIADRQGIAIGRSEHVYYLRDLTVIRVVKRVGGDCLVPQCFAVLEGTES